jgi:hypothetical protein
LEQLLDGQRFTVDLPSAETLEIVDTVPYKLLAPDRERQYGEMMKAIDQFCELIAANKTNQRESKYQA